MEKIDTIELLLAEIGYQRKTENVGYHTTLSRSVSSFRHYLKPLDFFESRYKSAREEELSGEGALITKKVYTYDSFLTHSKQYGEDEIKIEVSYRVKNGLVNLLREELHGTSENDTPDKKSFLGKLLGRKESKLRLTGFPRSEEELFANEANAINILTLYIEKCRELVQGDTSAMQRLGMLAEISNFQQIEDLAIIAKDTSDSDVEMFLSFLAKNADMDIKIRDYKQAYNVFSMVDKSQFLD